MVVFFDIDGTIIDDESQIIPQSAIRAVEQLKENGHIAVVNTGRPYSHIDARIREMAFSGWVCGCGMEILLDGRWLTRNAPDEALCSFVLDTVRDCRMQVLYEADGGAVYLDGELSTCPQAVKEADRMRSKGFLVAQISTLPRPEFMKLVVYDGPGCRRSEFLSKMKPYFTCIDRGGTMVELVKKGCSKAAGMEQLLQYLGISKEDTVAIGDSTNDLPMFDLAGHTVCMGGGMEELKRHAEYITAPVMEDGIEKALKHFGLI